ncbi:hypothetical protein BS50DRAFT_633849 [Corynespora cassiicola Philippines]|uniref:Uncharacterized protein n=1 Tax=Corynespora cassiicola Philippines TaxID=1448308 RepID=A0A2T2NSI6_CORCC|nr:hypothetical protein BS50DRAFT_633849 [Corynespora cassiicola Philippines]
MQQKAIIALSLVLSLSFLAAMVLIARFLWNHKSSKDSTPAPAAIDNTDGSSAMPKIEQRLSRISLDASAFKKVFAPKKEKGHQVPSLSGLIKAGDEGVYSSAMFNHSHGNPGDLFLESLYDAFANELRGRPASDRSAYSTAISKFATTSKGGLRRAQSVKPTKHGRPEVAPKPQRTSLDLAEKGLSRSRSRRLSPILVSTSSTLLSTDGAALSPIHSSWINEVQHAQYFDGHAGVVVSTSELAALSVILGTPLSIAQSSPNAEKSQEVVSVRKGAFNISITGIPLDDGNYRISLRQHKRRIAQLPAKGSGYSPLFAKHLASGALPYSQDKKAVNTIIITNETLEALRLGAGLQLQKAISHTRGSKFLSSIPNSRAPAYHVLAPSATSTSIQLLLHAVASLPFTGGLVPLASAPVIKTVHFIATAGLPPARLLQRLDALVEKVQRHAPSLQLFGPLLEDAHAGLLYRERERLGKLATGALTHEALADKTARMHRYITLLERLMHLVPDMKPQDVRDAVREATKKEMERAYEDAVNAHISGESEVSTTLPLHSLPRRQSKRLSAGSSLSSALFGAGAGSSEGTASPSPVPTDILSPRSSSTFPVHNLGRQVEQVLKVSLPFNVESIAMVARMIIVAWTLSVETVAWDDGEEGFRAADAKMDTPSLPPPPLFPAPMPLHHITSPRSIPDL